MTARKRLFSLLALAGCGGRYVDGMCQYPLEVGCELSDCPSLGGVLEAMRDCETTYSLVGCAEGGDMWTIAQGFDEDEWSSTSRVWGPDGEVVAIVESTDYNAYDCAGESSSVAVYGEIPECTATCVYERCEAGGTVTLATGEGACPAGTEPPGG